MQKKSNFRDELVQQIKDAGKELIDRANTMVHPDLDLITDYSIIVSFDLQHECCPEITFTTSVVNKRFMDRLTKKEKEMDEQEYT